MDERAHWLTEEQQRVWRDWLSGVARINQFLDADLHTHHLDLSEYEILVTLSESPERRMRMSDLAASVRQSRSRLTHTIARLEGRGLVERAAAVDDGRGVVAHLTDAGFEVLDTAAPGHVTAVREILVDACTPEDFAALGRVMTAVLAHGDQ